MTTNIKLDEYTVIAPYPCHPAHSIRINLFTDVPVQNFERICPNCKIEWTISTKTIKRNINQVTITKLTWAIYRRGYARSFKEANDV